jgi:phage-related protein
MSYPTYDAGVAKALIILGGAIKTPPLGVAARLQTGYLIRLLQNGATLSMPVSRPMPMIGNGCHELRIDDGVVSWRIVYAVRQDAIVILDVFQKKTQTTPKPVIRACAKRIRLYEEARRR